MKYVRNPECECKEYTDIDSVDFSKRKELQKFWQKGFIYEMGNSSSKECTCHKTYRLSNRYDVVAKKKGLLTYEELSKLNYIGSGDSYLKLKTLPKILKTHPSFKKDLIVFMTGVDGCQKTTSASKLMYNLTAEGEAVEYELFTDMVQKFVDMNYSPLEYILPDWLIIDDCFEGETINFKTVYNAFYNMILKRKGPTILISNKSEQWLFNEGKSLPSYNEDLLKKIFNKVHKLKTVIEFNDNVDKIKEVGTEPVDLWSLA